MPDATGRAYGRATPAEFGVATQAYLRDKLTEIAQALESADLENERHQALASEAMYHASTLLICLRQIAQAES